jgi:hypothetical protein
MRGRFRCALSPRENKREKHPLPSPALVSRESWPPCAPPPPLLASGRPGLARASGERELRDSPPQSATDPARERERALSLTRSPPSPPPPTPQTPAARPRPRPACRRWQSRRCVPLRASEFMERGGPSIFEGEKRSARADARSSCSRRGVCVFSAFPCLPKTRATAAPRPARAPPHSHRAGLDLRSGTGGLGGRPAHAVRIQGESRRARTHARFSPSLARGRRRPTLALTAPPTHPTTPHSHPLSASSASSPSATAPNGAPVAGGAPTPVVIIDNQSDAFATVVSIKYGDRLGELLDTVSGIEKEGRRERERKRKTKNAKKTHLTLSLFFFTKTKTNRPPPSKTWA